MAIRIEVTDRAGLAFVHRYSVAIRGLTRACGNVPIGSAVRRKDAIAAAVLEAKFFLRAEREGNAKRRLNTSS